MVTRVTQTTWSIFTFSSNAFSAVLPVVVRVTLLYPQTIGSIFTISINALSIRLPAAILVALFPKQHGENLHFY